MTETTVEARGGADAGTPLELASSHESHALVRANGSMFLVTGRDGNVAPAGARELGLFDRDTRHLSHWQLVLRGGDVVYLSAEASGNTVNRIDLMMTGPSEGNLDDPANFLHVCRIQLVDGGGLAENVELQSFVDRRLEIDLVLEYAADFADVFEVRGARRPRRGRALAPRIEADRAVLAYRGLDGVECSTTIRFDPTPHEISAHAARFRLVLEPRERAMVRAEVTTSRGPERRSVPDFEARRRALADEAEGFRSSAARFRCDDPVLQQGLDRASSDLLSLWLRGPHPILAAGIPWFCCPFGRDALIASYEALLFQPDLAAGSLRTLASFQGTRYDDYTEEEPGRILHELRMGEMARTGETPHRPYYGSIDSTPLFVVVAHAYWETTADLETIRALEPAIRAALGWIDVRSEEGSALVTYARRSPRGLDNQGWKDSRSGVCFPDGERAVPPIALAEVQGYCADAYARGAALLAALGDPDGSATYAARARRLIDHIEAVLWIAERGRYAFAIDGRGRKVDTMVSNLGHQLWSRVPSPEPALSTARALLDPASFGELGIRTLAADQPAYNPLSYHEGSIWPHDNALAASGMAHYGLAPMCARVLDTMREALARLEDRRLPELFAGIDAGPGALVRYPVACRPQAWAAAAPFLLLQSVLGIRFDAPGRVIQIRDPHLPDTMHELEIDRMRVGSARVCIRFRRVGRRCHVDRLDVEGGDGIRALVELGP